MVPRCSWKKVFSTSVVDIHRAGIDISCKFLKTHFHTLYTYLVIEPLCLTRTSLCENNLYPWCWCWSNCSSLCVTNTWSLLSLYICQHPQPTQQGADGKTLWLRIIKSDQRWETRRKLILSIIQHFTLHCVGNKASHYLGSNTHNKYTMLGASTTYVDACVLTKFLPRFCSGSVLKVP